MGLRVLVLELDRRESSADSRLFLPLCKNGCCLQNRKESLRQRFIVLGSSGERLPVSRRPCPRPASSGSHYSSCRSTSASTDDFVSARASLDEEDEDEDLEGGVGVGLLDTPERRRTFAARLRDALRLAREAEGSEDSSSYAVGISVAGSGVGDGDGGCRVRRGGSGGFVLREDSADERLQELSSEYSSGEWRRRGGRRREWRRR